MVPWFRKNSSVASLEGQGARGSVPRSARHPASHGCQAWSRREGHICWPWPPLGGVPPPRRSDIPALGDRRSAGAAHSNLHDWSHWRHQGLMPAVARPQKITFAENAQSKAFAASCGRSPALRFLAAVRKGPVPSNWAGPLSANSGIVTLRRRSRSCAPASDSDTALDHPAMSDDKATDSDSEVRIVRAR